MLKTIRKKLRINQTEMAKRCGVSQSHLSRIENNPRNYSMDVVGRMILELNNDWSKTKPYSLDVSSILSSIIE